MTISNLSIPALTNTIAFQLFQECIINGGPDIEHYDIINKWIDSLQTVEEFNLLRKCFEPVLEADTLFAHTVKRPYGYAGDFEIIEKIYERHEIKSKQFTKWDRYYQSFDACNAVRNRKDYFINQMASLVDRDNVKVLILGSGPASDVHEFLERFNGSQMEFDLVDLDQHAIDYSMNKNKEFLNQLNFVQKNVFKYWSNEKYDLIWSAGLFDYLIDEAFVKLLERFEGNLKPDGRMIVGNFSHKNPTKKIMEIMAKWCLYNRSEEQLEQLASDAGILIENCHVEEEPLGINLFLHIK